MRDKRFRWRALNARLRHETSGQKEVFYRDAPGAKDLDLDPVKKADKEDIVRRMVVLAKKITGTIGEA